MIFFYCVSEINGNLFFTKSGEIRNSKQWAAVRTHSDEITDAPQKNSPNIRKESLNG